MKQLPVSVSLLTHYLPHRPPMIWVDDVLAVTATGGTTQTVLMRHGHYADAAGAIGFATMAELMAQSFGYVEAAKHYLLDGDAKLPERAYLAHIRNYRVERLPNIGDVLHTAVDCIKTLGPLHLVHGVVTSATGQVYARAELKLFGGTPS